MGATTAQSSRNLIEYFPNSYMFMRTSQLSHAWRRVAAGIAGTYVAVQELRTLQRGLPDVPHFRSDIMTTATFRLSTPLGAAKAEPKRGVLARFFEAMMEARVRAALREIERHQHLIPEHLVKKAGYQATITNDSALP